MSERADPCPRCGCQHQTVTGPPWIKRCADCGLATEHTAAFEAMEDRDA